MGLQGILTGLRPEKERATLVVPGHKTLPKSRAVSLYDTKPQATEE
jgi:hypothetical protein